jgi:purine-binding chemotaxis protein CheW
MSQVIANQYLTFSLRHERFAIAVAQVREILDLAPIIRVPQQPDFISGVINLRGKVLPVVDLSRKFGLAAAEVSRDTCIVILEFSDEEGRGEVGALVDAVHEVIVLTPEEIEPPPRFGMGLETGLIAGMGKTTQGLVILLHVDHIFASAECQLLHALPEVVAIP